MKEKKKEKIDLDLKPKLINQLVIENAVKKYREER